MNEEEIDHSKKYYWGKFKMIRGKARKVWMRKAMTRERKLETKPDYRHMCKYK